MRFERDEIFTSIGDILVSVNPFKWIDPLYAGDVVNYFRNLRDGDEVPPHVFGIASLAFRGLRTGRMQSILISGESGAGKTEATKKCLQYFATVAGGGGMEQKLLSANPILEAFGNAKTVRNNNSSRFGKWMVVEFDKERMKIIGCSIQLIIEGRTSRM